MTIDRDLQNRFRFMHQQAGGVVGKHAVGALALARAERLLDEAEELEVAATRWEEDELPYDVGDVVTEEEAREKFASNEWTGPYVAVVSAAPWTSDSRAVLGGIVLGPRDVYGDPYARVVRAELALELEDDLRQAVGDALDAELASPLLA